jgi:hypothetical protein
MSFNAVMIYSLNGDLLGYAIKNDTLTKLQSTNMYAEHEISALNEQLRRLNTDVDLRQYWPNPKDPEVLRILDDEKFMPIEYVQAQVVDDELSTYIWELEQAVDERGNDLRHPDGKPVMTQGANLDEQNSIIRYKMAMIPKNPSDLMLRIKAASEVIARQRAGLS